MNLLKYYIFDVFFSVSFIWSVHAAGFPESKLQELNSGPSGFEKSQYEIAVAPELTQLDSQLTLSSEQLTVPAELQVASMNVTHIRSDRISEMIYAISEPTGEQAYLLEINSETETILRTIEVGSSVTDFTIHEAEGKIYVANWLQGSLLAVDRSSFQIVRTYPFKPFQGTGHGKGDVYRVSAGVAGRLVIEEEDQMIQIRLFDTNSGEVLSQTHRSEGGGQVSPNGQYYYHGDNNSSRAAIVKYDLTGDAFSLLKDVRPEGVSYFGSRTVVLAESGSHVFWANLVFDDQLNVVWKLGDMIQTFTPNGRYAVSATKIYDVFRKEAVLKMPSNYTASAYNSTSEKLVVATGDSIKFYSLSENAALPMPPPVLTAAIKNDVNVELMWSDESLERAFYIESKKAGDSNWSSYPPIDANKTTQLITGLAEGIEYTFRIRAESGPISSEWSESVSIVIGLIPPLTPQARVQTVNSLDIIVTWLELTADYIHFEYKKTLPSGGDIWQEVGIVKASDKITQLYGLEPETFYEFRLRSEKNGVFSEFAYLEATTVSLPPPERPVFQDIATTQGPGTFLLEWSQATNAESLILYVRVYGESEFVELDTLEWFRTTYLHSGLDPGKFYEYRIKAINATGSVFSEITMPRTTSVSIVLEDDFDSGPLMDVWDVLVGVDNTLGGPGNSVAAQFFAGSLRAMETIPLPLATLTEIEFQIRLPSFFDDDIRWWPTPKESFIEVEIYDGSDWSSLLHLSTSISLPGWQKYRVTFDGSKVIGHSKIRWIQYGNGPVGNSWGLDNVRVLAQPLLPPSVPQSVNIGSGDDGRYVVTWEKSEYAQRYLVERSIDQGASWSLFGDTESLFITDPIFHNNSRVGYRVIAKNTTGFSNASEAAWIGESNNGGGEGNQNTITASGRVFYMGRHEHPISGATVFLIQDGKMQQTLTDADGQYQFEAEVGKPIVIQAEMIGYSQANRGVDVADIIGLRKHILNRSRFGASLEWVAADVNRDGSVDVSDIVQMRKVILTRDDAFSRDAQGGKYSIWRLVCSDFIGINADRSFVELPNFEFCEYDDVTASIGGADFAAIKLGDSNSDWTLEEAIQPLSPRFEINETGVYQRRKRDVDHFMRGEGKLLNDGITIEVPVIVNKDLDLLGMEFDFQWNSSAFRLSKIRSELLPAFYESVHSHATTGAVKIMWDDSTLSGIHAQEGDVLLYFHFAPRNNLPPRLNVDLINPVIVLKEGNDNQGVVQASSGYFGGTLNHSFKIRCIEGLVEVSFISDRGVDYFIEKCDELKKGDWQLLAQIHGAGGRESFVEKAQVQHGCFYRLIKRR